jgi:hypothetical protein
MMLNGNGALDTSTHRLLNRVRDEIASHRLDPVRARDSEAPTQELRSQSSMRPPRTPQAARTYRYPQV